MRRTRLFNVLLLIPNFNPRTPRGVRQPGLFRVGRNLRFQSTHPARGATAFDSYVNEFVLGFQSTHPARGATVQPHGPGTRPTRFQSTHPARGATPFTPEILDAIPISIHAPREGCDVRTIHRGRIIGYFNPRTPRGVRHDYFTSALPAPQFQSTHPARGATDPGLTIAPGPIISIHAPREGCDFDVQQEVSYLLGFQSTHPARGATHGLQHFGAVIFISIHAPREGCDVILFGGEAEKTNFNPRTPRGVRRMKFFPVTLFRYFNPRTPRGVRPRFSPTSASSLSYFNPRTPRGVRQQTLPKSREFAWLNLLICTRGRRLSIQKQTRLCSIKLSFMLFGCEPAGEGVSSWTSHATKSKVRLEGRSA